MFGQSGLHLIGVSIIVAIRKPTNCEADILDNPETSEEPIGTTKKKQRLEMAD